MLSVFLLNVVMLNVVMLIVVAPSMIDLSANQSTHGGAKESFTHTRFLPRFHPAFGQLFMPSLIFAAKERVYDTSLHLYTDKLLASWN
jgi:hypothetical protein